MSNEIGEITKNIKAVDDFAHVMKAKMTNSFIKKGRSGWDNPEECSVEDLWRMLREHVEKGDPVDIANFSMMIWHRQQKNR